MNRELVQDKTFKWIMWAQFFLALGFLASPTIVSLYHILIFIPTIILYKRGERFKIPKSAWFLIALTIWGIISNTVNLDELNKVRKSYDDLKFYLSGALLLVPLNYFYQRANPYQIKKLINIVISIVCIAFVVGIVKAYFGFDLVGWKSGNWQPRSDGLTNYMRYGYASSFLFILGMSFVLNWHKVQKYINPKLFILALILCLLAVFAAKTRGALLAIMVGIPFLYLRYKPKIASVIIAMGIIFVGIVSYYSFTGAKAPSRFLNINDGSNKIRLSQFQSAIYSIKEKPIFGVGASQLSYHVKRIKKQYGLGYQYYTGHAHNIFLEHAANFGIPGLILLLGFLIFWFIYIVSLKSSVGWGIASYLVAFVASGQVENLFDNTNSHLLFYIYCLSYILPKIKNTKETL